jgi:site-specific recombinase XerD
MMRVLYSTGCRIGELVSMVVSETTITRVDNQTLSDVEQSIVDIAKESNSLHLIKPSCLYQYRGKSRVIGKGQSGRREPRPIFFDNETCKALTDYLKSRPFNAPDPIWLQT